MTTINDLLFGGAGAARRKLGGAVALVNAARQQLPVSAHAGGALASLFDMPVGNLLLDVWYGNRSVRTACAHTLAQPGLREEVELFTTTVTCTYAPALDLESAGARRTIAEFELEIELELDTLVLEVTAGRVAAVGPATGAAHATLRAGRTVLAERRTHKVDIGRAVRLGGAPGPDVSALVGRADTPGVRRRRRRPAA